MLSFALRVLVREGVKSKLLFRSSCFPERRKERLARKPSISNQSNLPVIICDQHQITPARHDPSSLRCNGPLYGCVYTGGGRGEKGRERKRERESVCRCVCEGGTASFTGMGIAASPGSRRTELPEPAEPKVAGPGLSGEPGTRPRRRLRLTSASPPPPRSSWASLTGVKLIINRVKLIKGLGARWGRSESPSPTRSLCIRLPTGSGPGAGTDRRRQARGAPGQLNPSRKEKGGGDRGGGGRRRLQQPTPLGGWL